jgi:hypothetical protein
MTVLARPNHPARLAGVFVFSVLAFGLVAAAAGAVLYIIQNERASATPSTVSGGTVDLPPGMVQIRRIDSFAAWKDALGFAPLLPDALPEGVANAPALYLQQPDASGRPAGHVRYARADGSPAVVLIEQQGTISAEPLLKTAETDGTRLHLQTFTCGSLVVQAQLYFQSDPNPLPPVSQTEDAATSFIEGLRQQCG